MSSKSRLFVVATPIGNPDDITLRALKVLEDADFVICEEFKVGSRLLKFYDIQKPLELLNEHNETEKTAELISRLLTSGEKAVLISDAGTPLFADPGSNLVRECHYNNIEVKPVPGASSIMAALMASGVTIDKFLYYGFLPANKDERKEELKKLSNKYNIVFLEAPYRLRQLLSDMKRFLGQKREALVCYKLTQPEEKIFWGTLDELLIMTEELPKGEFVIILKKIDFKGKIK